MLPEAVGQHFQADLIRQITCLLFFFFWGKLVLQITNGFVCATLSFNRLARCLLTICKKNLCNQRVIKILNQDVLKKRYFSIYFMIVAFISQVTFSKIVFPVKNFVRSVKFFHKNILSVAVIKNTCMYVCSMHLKSDFSILNWIEESREIP